MYEFQRHIEEEHNVQLPDYEALRKWSIHNLDDFWKSVWYFTGVVAKTPMTKVGR